MNKTPLNILLADDDPDDCSLFKEALHDLSVNADLTTVHDGVQLMNFLASAGPGNVFIEPQLVANVWL